ncbi:hypothetical protein VOLCADRAFT_90797 [Volvox carteri f. nagariensis]|uniref:Uncharacterized protein n=1 Tax=Volvox carteri f. nagariensis TaxID=3068 RepID=D8TV29_VOLCA|nr:uncharacterized protein VOLCADRAFT_90797 [Volvox carteri f. nagariensis]EFJ48506.1 hypothetical protein VOLCADRAFT_90797 [Volvox carteri f. nagariensis]|eukprot:XP_002950305.1 hypothetical protein VOLCADRAFT_90797 [Volvox carteri f. nagariensis]
MHTYNPRCNTGAYGGKNGGVLAFARADHHNKTVDCLSAAQAQTYGAPHLARHPVTSKDFCLRVPYTSPGVTVFGVSDLPPKTFDALRRACSENEQTLDSVA